MSTMADDHHSEPKLTGYTALRTISRTAGLLTGRRRQDRQGNEPRKMTRAAGAVSVDLVNGKLLQTIHGISLIQVSILHRGVVTGTTGGHALSLPPSKILRE